jgi:hypothetical protein
VISIENDMSCQKYAKYAIKYAEYAKSVFLKKICRICTPHFADGRWSRGWWRPADSDRRGGGRRPASLPVSCPDPDGRVDGLAHEPNKCKYKDHHSRTGGPAGSRFIAFSITRLLYLYHQLIAKLTDSSP